MIFLSSCFAHINYLGNSFPSTKEPDFYVDERSINKPYKIVGKGYPNGFGSLTLQTLQKKAIEKAKKKGADAVLVQDYFIQAAVANSTIYHTDGKGKESRKFYLLKRICRHPVYYFILKIYQNNNR
jgi:hypothetical protein